MLQLDLEAPCNDFELEERLDLKDPFRHLMKQQDDDLQDADGLARASASTLELLTVLPQQCHSVEDNGLLKLSFSHYWKNVPNPLSISLHVDATPGCGGLAWPAGQVDFFCVAFVSSQLREIDSCQLPSSKRTRVLLE